MTPPVLCLLLGVTFIEESESVCPGFLASMSASVVAKLTSDLELLGDSVVLLFFTFSLAEFRVDTVGKGARAGIERVVVVIAGGLVRTVGLEVVEKT